MKSGNSILLKNFWHLICHRSEVAKARDFVRLDVAGEEVVAFHDGSDVIAFNNMCPHRGTRIFDGNSGNAPFRCRYHGWSFSNGKLFIGDKSQFAHCVSDEIQLQQFQTAWIGDFLFTSENPMLSLTEQLGEQYDVVEKISLSIDRREDLDSYQYNCEWQIALENALESYHVGVVHPNTLNNLKLAKGQDRFDGFNSSWLTEVGDIALSKRLAKMKRFFDIEYQHEGYVNILLFPFTMLSSTFGYSYSVQHFTPSLEIDRCHFVSRLFSAKVSATTKRELFASFFRSTAEINRQVFAEDNAICGRIPSRSWASSPPRLFADSERRILHFRQSYIKALGLN